MVKNVILHGDCLEKLRELDDNSIDAVVTDPPYGLSKEPNIVEVLTKWLAGDDYEHRGNGFMGKSWDSFVPGPSIWREVFRVLKPGGHALVFAGTRTQDLMTISLRLAGFEVRDVTEWLYFSSFPKSLDVGKQLDKRKGGAVLVDEFSQTIKRRRLEKGYSLSFMDKEVCGGTTNYSWFEGRPAGVRLPGVSEYKRIKELLDLDDRYDELIEPAEREIIGKSKTGASAIMGNKLKGKCDERGNKVFKFDITAPATELAKKWDGWGTQTKPAHEPVIVASKPLTVHDVLDIYFMEVAECLTLLVKIAVNNSTLNLQEYAEVYDFARNRVEPPQHIQEGLYGLMDTSQLKEMTESINWNTVLSCLNTLGDLLKNGNMFTISTALSMITELKTLNYLQSTSTLEHTIKEKTNQDGANVFVSNAAKDLNEELSRLNGILQRLVLGNVTSSENEQEKYSKHEPIVLCRKPIEKNVAYNVEKWGCGAININGCRIWDENKAGRFPANCVTTEPDMFYSKYFNVTPPELCKKASKKDRLSTWDGRQIDANQHPTIKPVELMAWLCRLITPPGGIVVDPFAGSGSTLVAAKREGFNYIGIERESEYVEIARARVGEEIEKEDE